jgi:DNA-binding transcriptional ArsR family regulator
MGNSKKEVTFIEGGRQVALNYEELKKAATVLRAVNHNLRQEIINLLEETKKMTVTEIYLALKLEQSVASQHLAILRRANVVETTREGKYVFYHLNPLRLLQIKILTDDLLQD